MLAAIGLNRGTVYIANILKCRPPDNRDPRPDEAAHCTPYLARQIELMNPGIILAVGRVAAQNLLQIDTPIGRMRGQQYFYGERRIPVVVTYHPAYLLRSPREKRKVWQDLQLAKRIASGGA
jgi:DNA polymerase